MMAAVSSRSVWFNVRSPKPAARVRLVCFPWSGGGSQWYAHTMGCLAPPDVEVVGLTYPRRESRYKDVPCQSLEELTDTIAGEISKHLSDKPFAFFGHSFGVTTSFEVCRKLIAKSSPTSIHMFFSGHWAPHIFPLDIPLSYGEQSDVRRKMIDEWSRDPWDRLSDEGLTERLKKLDGIPDSILSDKDFMSNIFLPPFRADIRIGVPYIYEKQDSDPPPLTCPITTINGDKDDDFRTHEYSELTTGFCTHSILPGGHFYLKAPANSKKLMDIICNQLK